MINNLLKVSNQGTQSVDFEVDLSNLSTGSATVTVSTDEEGSSDDLTSTPVTIPAGNSVEIDVEIDTNGQGPASTSGTIEFIANAT
jgi:phosphatidate phosphatase APP1